MGLRASRPLCEMRSGMPTLDSESSVSLTLSQREFGVARPSRAIGHRWTWRSTQQWSPSLFAAIHPLSPETRRALALTLLGGHGLLITRVWDAADAAIKEAIANHGGVAPMAYDSLMEASQAGLILAFLALARADKARDVWRTLALSISATLLFGTLSFLQGATDEMERLLSVSASQH